MQDRYVDGKLDEKNNGRGLGNRSSRVQHHAERAVIGITGGGMNMHHLHHRQQCQQNQTHQHHDRESSWLHATLAATVLCLESGDQTRLFYSGYTVLDVSVRTQSQELHEFNPIPHQRAPGGFV